MNIGANEKIYDTTRGSLVSHENLGTFIKDCNVSGNVCVQGDWPLYSANEAMPCFALQIDLQ